MERFIKQKKTLVCGLGTRGKSEKRVGCACHKSGPTPFPNPLQRLGLPYKEYLPSSPRNLEKTGAGWGQGAPRGTLQGLEAWSSSWESGRWSAPPQGEDC